MKNNFKFKMLVKYEHCFSIVWFCRDLSENSDSTCGGGWMKHLNHFLDLKEFKNHPCRTRKQKGPPLGYFGKEK